MEPYEKISIPDIWNADFGDSDRISHRCAMPFPDVRHGKALGRKHLCSLRSHRLLVMHILQKQAFDDTKKNAVTHIHD